MLAPVGFWSYARQDDNHSDGQLSQLRAIVGNAVNLRYGAEVLLWQDIAAIPFGANWASQIDETIDQVTFFIPIVTPRFLKSENCLDEFRAFGRRMKALGRDDLIFPIHYVDVENLRPAETAFGSELDALRLHQWIDFRPIIFEDMRSPQVKRWADKFAAGILSAMRRERPTAPQTTDGRSETPSGRGADLAASEVERPRAKPRDAAPAAEPERPHDVKPAPSQAAAPAAAPHAPESLAATFESGPREAGSPTGSKIGFGLANSARSARVGISVATFVVVLLGFRVTVSDHLLETNWLVLHALSLSSLIAICCAPLGKIINVVLSYVVLALLAAASVAIAHSYGFLPTRDYQELYSDPDLLVWFLAFQALPLTAAIIGSYVIERVGGWRA